MTDAEKPREPFLNLVSKNAPVVHLLVERISHLEFLCEKVLKRMQQTGLMVDGFGSNLNRRVDVLHEELALLRAGVERPLDIPVSVEQPFPLTRKQPSLKRAAIVAGKAASYSTTIAIVLRLIGKQFPQYGEAIDGVLGMFGL